MIVKESLIIKQAGYTFDGKKHCGSSFNTGASSSNKAAVTAKKTTVKKTTTVVSKPTTVVTNTNANAANTAAKPAVNNAAAAKPAINNTAATAANNASVSNNEVASKTKEEIIVDNDMFTITETTVIEPDGVVPVNEAVDPSIAPVETSNPVISTTPVEEDNSKEVSDQFNKEEESNTGTIVGVAVTGSVVGAAALALLIKKNPKQYEQIKRSISRRATSVRRGASTISRRLTNKKPKQITLPRNNEYAVIENANAVVESNNKNEYNFSNYNYEPNDKDFNENAYNMNSYRYKFTQNLDDFLN